MLITTLITLILSGNINGNATLYPETAIVREIDPVEDTVLVEAGNGNLFVFKGTEDWEEDDVCSMLMSDNGTANVADDEILSVKYSREVR